MSNPIQSSLLLYAQDGRLLDEWLCKVTQPRLHTLYKDLAIHRVPKDLDLIGASVVVDADLFEEISCHLLDGGNLAFVAGMHLMSSEACADPNLIPDDWVFELSLFEQGTEVCIEEIDLPPPSVSPVELRKVLGLPKMHNLI